MPRLSKIGAACLAAFGFSGNSTPAPYLVSKSLRFRSSANGFLSRTPASAGNRKTWTYSVWLKAGALGTYRGLLEGYTGAPAFANRTSLQLEAGNKIDILFDNTSSGRLTTAQVFDDPAAYYHFVFACDTTQATASNRFKLYVNGSQVTAFDTASYPAQNFDTGINTTQVHNIGKVIDPLYFDGYMTNVDFIDGQALTPASFGEFDSVITTLWKPKKYTGTYGSNGFKLDFSDNSGSTATTIGKDSSGNGNNWTPNNISVTAGATYDSMTDVPTLTSATAANYAVANPLNKQSDVVVSDGNLKISLGSVTGGIRKTNASIALPTTGKYYWETKNVGSTNINIFCGIQALTASLSVSATGDIFYNEAGEIQNNGSATTGFGSIAANDILGIAYDADVNKLYFYKNNVLQNSSGTTPSFAGPYIPFFGMYLTNNGQEINFGQRPFTYTPPSGFVALNTYNLPTPAIPAGSAAMNIALDTGANIKSTTEALFSGSQFLEWIKDRANVNNHQLLNSVRGLSAVLQSNSGGVETTYSAPAGSSVGLAWKAGSSAVTNTAGSISSQVSANPSAGFSIVTFNGTGSVGTVGHGLGAALNLIIWKTLNQTNNWNTYHSSIGNTGAIQLNLTGGTSTDVNYWNNTSPSSSVFTVGPYTSPSAISCVAFCWAEVPGFSKFGRYTGDSNLPFIYTGFKPKFVLIKITSTTADWIIWDSARNTYNVVNSKLSPNTSSAEYTDTTAVGIDFLSNGFKLKGSDIAVNGGGNNYIFAAFAENPFKYANAR
jgi:hypothetical protein